jgi:MinD-like ATPase involved in chromosome partitioning or flagellar assembly
MPEIIAIHSYRGGTGKSNLTANLATTLALQGKRVAAIDTDIQSPGIHNIFDLDANSLERTLNDYLWGYYPLETAAYDVSAAAGVSHRGQLFLVPASSNLDDIARVLSEGYSASHLNRGIQQLLKTLELDYLFLDTHPGLSKETFLSVAIAHRLLIVLRPDRQDFQGTAVMVDLAKQLKVAAMGLVLNMVPADIDIADLRRQVGNTYEATVAGILPASEDLMRLGSNGVFCQEFPTHAWTAALQEVVQTLACSPTRSLIS